MQTKCPFVGGQTYEGTKRLKAWPLTRGAYNTYRGWVTPEGENESDPGYLVEYLDGGLPNHENHEGYISWSPADVFERAYHETTGEKHSGLPVSGYRPQSEENIATVNAFKADEERLLRKIDAMMTATRAGPLSSGPSPYDGRWLAVGRTHLEQAFMALNRAVFMPGRVSLPEDAEKGE